MANPFQQLKYLPWLLLLQVAALTTFIIVILEFLLRLGYRSLAIRQALYLIFAPPFGLLANLAIAVGIGVLAVLLLERLYRQVTISAAVLWALVLCLAVTLVLKSLLPIPRLLVNFDEIRLIGTIVGVFWKGRPYWR